MGSTSRVIVHPGVACRCEGLTGHLRIVGTPAAQRGCTIAARCCGIRAAALSLACYRSVKLPGLQELERFYGDRLLPVDAETSHIWGELSAAAQQAGCAVPASDGLIAATARRHGLHVMTRNTGHFQPTVVMVINPWPTP